MGCVPFKLGEGRKKGGGVIKLESVLLWFINHSDTPNCELKLFELEFETETGSSIYIPKITIMKNIKKDTELTYDYGKVYYTFTTLMLHFCYTLHTLLLHFAYTYTCFRDTGYPTSCTRKSDFLPARRRTNHRITVKFLIRKFYVCAN